MKRQPWLGFVAGLGIASSLAGLHGCFVCGDRSLADYNRLPSGRFFVPPTDLWEGVSPEGLYMNFDGKHLLVEYTIVDTDDPEVEDDDEIEIEVEVEYEVVLREVR